MNKNEQILRDATQLMAESFQELGRRLTLALTPLREAAKTAESEPSPMVEILAQHQLRESGMTRGSADRCSCGIPTQPTGESWSQEARNRAFAQHQVDVLAAGGCTDPIECGHEAAAQWVELRNLCLEHLKPPTYSGGSWTLNPNDLAEAIVKLGWRPVMVS